MGPSSDAPRAREVGAGQEGGPVIRNVVYDAVNEFLREPPVARFARSENPLHFPVKALARKPQRVRCQFRIYIKRQSTHQQRLWETHKKKWPYRDEKGEIC